MSNQGQVASALGGHDGAREGMGSLHKETVALTGTQAGVQELVPEGHLKTHGKDWRRAMTGQELATKKQLVATVEKQSGATTEPRAES